MTNQNFPNTPAQFSTFAWALQADAEAVAEMTKWLKLIELMKPSDLRDNAEMQLQLAALLALAED